MTICTMGAELLHGWTLFAILRMHLKYIFAYILEVINLFTIHHPLLFSCLLYCAIL